MCNGRLAGHNEFYTCGRCYAAWKLGYGMLFTSLPHSPHRGKLEWPREQKEEQHGEKNDEDKAAKNDEKTDEKKDDNDEDGEKAPSKKQRRQE